MTSFYSSLAHFFRKSNSKLIYTQPWLVLKFRKIIFYISTKVYKRWVNYHHSPEVILIDNIDKSISMHVDVAKAMGAAFYWMGFHEFNEWRYLHKFLKPEMVFLDIGANQGEYALFAAKRLTSGRVIAFEPVDFFYKILCDNKSLNKFDNILVLNNGLSDYEGSLPIFMGASDQAGEHEGLATLYPTGVRSRFVQNVKLEVLDKIWDSLKTNRIDIVKIDVEGAELKVLLGMKDLIAKFKPHILIEMNEVTFQAAGYDKENIISFFTEFAYKPFVITKHGVLRAAHALSSFSNIVFVPQ
jgi:FkbM family methyltransferase